MNKNSQKPTVSIVVITYNQSTTLPQTLDSILMQKGDFSLQIVLCDDASTEQRNREICSEYSEKYPENVLLISHKENVGILRNTISGLKSCTGDFVGICAGDDYWIDDRKIEKQLEFFSNNSDFGAVCTNGYRLLVKKNRLVEGIAPLSPIESGEVFDISWRGGVYAMPVSVLYRKEILDKCDLDEFIKREFSVEDVPLQAIVAHHSKFGYLADKTCVYRIYKESATHISYNHPKYLFYHKGLVAIRKYLHELFPTKVEYSDVWAEEYLLYKEFLMYLYQLKFSAAKRLFAEEKNYSEHKINRAKRVTKNRFLFLGFYIIKRLKNG